MEETIYDYFKDKYENCNTYIRLGDIAYSKDDWEQAIWWYQIANFNCQRTLDAWDKLSMAFHHFGDKPAAAHAVRMALKYDMSENRRKRLKKNLYIFDPKTINDDPEYYDQFWTDHPDPKSLEKLRIEEMAEMISKDRTVLDVGCGPGWLIDHLEPHVRYMGIDFSPVARDMVAKRGGEAAKSLDDVDDNWQVVVLGEILEHIDDDVGFLKKAAKKLVENGHLLVSVPRHGAMKDSAHVRDYTAEELNEKLGKVGIIVDSKTFKQWEIRKVQWLGYPMEYP